MDSELRQQIERALAAAGTAPERATLVYEMVCVAYDRVKFYYAPGDSDERLSLAKVSDEADAHYARMQGVPPRTGRAQDDENRPAGEGAAQELTITRASRSSQAPPTTTPDASNRHQREFERQRVAREAAALGLSVQEYEEFLEAATATEHQQPTPGAGPHLPGYIEPYEYRAPQQDNEHGRSL